MREGLIESPTGTLRTALGVQILVELFSRSALTNGDLTLMTTESTTLFGIYTSSKDITIHGLNPMLLTGLTVLHDGQLLC